MKLRFTGISRNQHSRLRGIMKDHEHLLPHWVSEVVMADDPNEENIASCSPSSRYRRMIIYVSKSILSESDEVLEPVIRHEIAHGYNEEILNVLHNYIPELITNEDVGKILHKVIMDKVEGQTEDLAILFGELMDG